MNRRYDLDWLRVMAFAILMLFHTGMMFSSWDWHIKNLETSGVFDFVMSFVHQWRMPLLKLDMGRLFGGLVGASEENMRQAVIFGSVMASLNVEAFSLDRLLTLTRTEIDARYRAFEKLTRF